MRHKFLFVFCFLFLFMSMALVSANFFSDGYYDNGLYWMQRIPDGYIEIGGNNSYDINLKDLVPAYAENATYLTFENPDTGNEVTLYGSQSPYHVGGYYNTSKFKVYMSASFELGDSLIEIQSEDGFTDQEFTLYMADTPETTQSSQTFTVTALSTIPYQVSTRAPFRISTAEGSVWSYDLNEMLRSETYNMVDVTIDGNTISTSLDGTTDCMTVDGVEYCLHPYGWISSLPGRIIFSAESTDSAVASSGDIDFEVYLHGEHQPYSSELGYWSDAIVTPFRGFDNGPQNWDVYNYTITVPYEHFDSDTPSDNSIGGPYDRDENIGIPGEGAVGNTVDAFTGLFPSSDSLTLREKVMYVVVTCFFVFVIIVIGCYGVTREFSKGVLWIAGLFEFLILVFFLAIGYIPIGALVVAVLFLLALIYLRRGGG